ncbi:NAD(P)-dependent dehydrogenase (short-subunit alcohol dehydrogenase family) [Paenibacillus phyllosphaerae]|uniref:NAD(P)-dependent dehydrogenase (Short-subunit alcohol dehydrogenase family) n=1 Tax=Paenibacillus phyllosphaerae TaxID=274593 RepID=A0A7W5B159_9BACL|nr:SDR family oxidoreductase [Paenibacillus phyllosphaerae]MBB3112535.1 NAD(P)-dependent dehydrogenase (short-subunit alcohol dehydrogenase family) [Paenibacillus phyllosphaerae]
MTQPLLGKVAVVAGATRGAGRGIAVMLGEAGATVYVTGRSTQGNLSDMGRSETIEETAALVDARGGRGIPVRVDYTAEADVAALAARITDEQNGQLDLLVNDVWGCDSLTSWGVPFWEDSLHNGLLIQQRAVHTHLTASLHLVPLIVRRGSGLVIEITDGFDYRYRGNLFYSLAKVSTIHLAQAMAADLRPHNVAAVSLSPGFLRSEAMLEHFGVTETNWQDGAAKDVHFLQSETPSYVGRAVAALAADPGIMSLSGHILTSWGLADRYGFTDQDGRTPHWGRYAAEQGFYEPYIHSGE